jgi:hypothetical protein
MPTSTIHSALHAWKEHLGSDHVLSDAQETERKQRATFSHSHEVLAILKTTVLSK